MPIGELTYPEALAEFVKTDCRGKQYDTCVDSPCPYASINGCQHPKHPRRVHGTH
jgi:hypothetical protein